MPYAPTSWKDLGDELQNLFRKITCNDGGKISVILREAINSVKSCPFTEKVRDNRAKNSAYTAKEKASFTQHCINSLGMSANDTPLIENCWDFADYQFNSPNICNGNSGLFTQEGFQIGSPWHGDILQAPVLFLSSNPGVTLRCLFPRWHPSRGFFTMGGIDSAGNETYTITAGGKPVANRVDGVEQIYEFLRGRLSETAYVNPDSGYPDAWVISNGNICKNKGGVQYWQGLYNIMNGLLCFGKNVPASTEHTHRLMRTVLSAEIIPFGSQDEYGVSEAALDFFRDKFIVPLLEKCRAEIIFLAGKKTRECFSRAAKAIAPSVESFVNGKNYPDTDFFLNGTKKVFHVAVIDSPNAHGEKNHSEVCGFMKKESTSNSLLYGAIDKARKLYGL